MTSSTYNNIQTRHKKRYFSQIPYNGLYDTEDLNSLILPRKKDIKSVTSLQKKDKNRL